MQIIRHEEGWTRDKVNSITGFNTYAQYSKHYGAKWNAGIKE